jgi:hypothetical protein
MISKLTSYSPIEKLLCMTVRFLASVRLP